jgi:hypothetical protein
MTGKRVGVIQNILLAMADLFFRPSNMAIILAYEGGPKFMIPLHVSFPIGVQPFGNVSFYLFSDLQLYTVFKN